MDIKRQIRAGLPQVGSAPYRQVHAHSTGNPNSTAQNEADFMGRKDINTGFYTHVVGNGQIIQVGEVNRGAWDVGGGWNSETYAAVELIESHKSLAEFLPDYRLFCGLLKELCNQAGIPVTVDSADLAGIKTHNYCTYHQPSNGSDHVDPIPYLAKWGIGLEQFRKDVAQGSDKTKTEGEDEMAEVIIWMDDDHAGFKKGRGYYWNPINGFKYVPHPDCIVALNFGRAVPIKQIHSSKKAPWVSRYQQINKEVRD